MEYVEKPYLVALVIILTIVSTVYVAVDLTLVTINDVNEANDICDWAYISGSGTIYCKSGVRVKLSN